MSVAGAPAAQNARAVPTEERLRLPETIRGVGYAALLVWLNAYVCREMFVHYTPHMNSMQGFWIALSRLGGGGWFHSDWWRYWDCGSPLEFVYAPLVPAMTAWMAAVRGIPHDVAFQAVSGCIYCLAPVTLFGMAWLLTRAPGHAFAAAVLYSLSAPSQLIVPDVPFSIQHLWDARRLYLEAVWDETPHLAALAILPLAILFLSLSIRTRRTVYYAATTLAIAACSLASDFGPVLVAMASLCLLFVLRRQDIVRNLLVTAGIGLFSYATCCPFLSPANIRAVREASAGGPGGSWSLGSFTALAIVATGWALLWHYLPRWTPDWRVHFFALFAWLTGSVPLIAFYLNRQFLPQPGRYKIEMDFSLALLAVFAVRPLFARFPRTLRVCTLFLLVAFAAEQIVTERKFAKAVLPSVDVTQTIEYRTSIWVRDHLPGVRIMLPGSIGQWANAFTDIQQFAGGSWSVAYNQVQHRATEGIYKGGETAEADARVSIAWLKAFGAGAVAVSGPKSQEFWKAFAHPAKFDGHLPVLWSADDVTIYRVPLRTDSFAHVVPESALVRRAPRSPTDTEETEKYVAALDDESLPKAEFRWQGVNRIHIRTQAWPGQAVSVQVTHHPGWHAKANGAARQIEADGLGLMWLQPGCHGPCDVQLEYDGGAELRICHLLSSIALAALAVFFCWRVVLRMIPMIRKPGLAVAMLIALSAASVHAQAQSIVLDREGSTIVFEPYAPNIIRVTLSLLKDQATAPPGYGFVAHPSADGWSRQGDVYRSSRLVVTLERNRPGTPLPTQLDIAKFFNGSTPAAHVTIAGVAGKMSGKILVDLKNWSMSVPNYKDGDAGVGHDRRASDAAFYQVGATFASPDDEHYYGLGQNQEGFLDHRGHTVECWHNYTAPGGPTVCVPFVVTNRGYGMIWDNPSRTTIEPGFNEQTKWTSEVGDRVSFFVIAGNSTDEIYAGYRLLTGATPMLPKAAYGYIQCKQRYSSQEEVLTVAKGYRERGLPADVMVVDWFYWTRMGQIDMDPVKWPDPAAMNRQLHDMGFQTMISVWPRFVPGTRYYDMLLKKGWFEQLADGTPTDGLPYDRAGSDIDTTNPDAARWYWETIRDNILSKGFDALWTDETEPDLPPNGSYFHIGPGTRYFNIYPLFHTAAVYDGFRRDTKHRALILSRDAYLGAQRNGTLFWSSDIYPTWDTLKRQIPAGLDFAASGFAYWTNDIGGWQYLPAEHRPEYAPLLDPSDARDNVGGYDDYPELYTRWFEYAAFLPVFRAHGSRKFNEVWSYGKAAQPILEKYLKLRYQLMPYIYSLAYKTYESGAPYMRALFMDFPDDPRAGNRRDEYMFGPAFLVAPITEQGATSRMVYLPAGTDWYNYWTMERARGGQTIKVDAPIGTLPLFVRAGSIVPMGAPVNSTNETQKLAAVRVFGGADGDFTLYSDDGKTYAYERGDVTVTRLHWDDATRRLSYNGAPVEVMGK